MKKILQQIYNHKIELVNFLKTKNSQKELERKITSIKSSRGFISKINSNIKNNCLSIIAEIKKASPSKGIIKKNFYPKDIAKQYQNGGAACISVLTDNKYFLGTNEDLMAVKKVTSLPILRKDFIVSEYQIFESKIIGADCILLISEILNKDEIKNYIKLAKSIDLDVIIEVHGSDNFEKYIDEDGVLLGINNRNLNNMSVDINHALNIARKHDKYNLICESGIISLNQFKEIVNNGFRNFLIGEYFMRSKNIEKEIFKFSNFKPENKDF